VKSASSPQQTHAHLRENNPECAQANIILLPHWVWPLTELGTEGFSSVVFAVDDKAHHIHLLKSVRSLAAWEEMVWV